MLLKHIRSRDGSVGIMMGCRLDGKGLNPVSGKIFVFSTTSRSALGPTYPPIWLVLWEISLGLK
jgi:hypothetical protein